MESCVSLPLSLMSRDLGQLPFLVCSRNRLDYFIFKVSFTSRGKTIYGYRPAPFNLSQETCSKHLLCAGQDELDMRPVVKKPVAYGGKGRRHAHTLGARHKQYARGWGGATEQAAGACPPPPPYLSSVPFCMISPRTSIAPLKCLQDHVWGN